MEARAEKKYWDTNWDTICIDGDAKIIIFSLPQKKACSPQWSAAQMATHARILYVIHELAACMHVMLESVACPGVAEVGCGSLLQITHRLTVQHSRSMLYWTSFRMPKLHAGPMSLDFAATMEVSFNCSTNDGAEMQDNQQGRTPELA